MQISVKGDVKEALRHLRFVRAEQIPYATKLAIDDVLKQAAPAVKAHMSSELDKPTPWTLNSFRILKWAKKNDPTGIIGFKDMGYKGGPSGKAGSAAPTCNRSCPARRALPSVWKDCCAPRA